MYTTQSKMISRAIWVEKKHVWKINLQKNGVRKSFYSSVPGDKGRKICAQNATSWLSGACPFSVSERTTVDYADDDAALEQMLDSVVHELNHRRTEFSIAGCANLEEYVQTTGEELHRIVVILDETSMILDTTGRDKDGKAVVASITNKLLAIGRLGRALGIHLLVATQRPDVGSVPGSLKAQLDGRICGHTADAQSSIVILDDGSAAKLPAIPGRFIIRNGSGSDEIIQAYYYHQ